MHVTRLSIRGEEEKVVQPQNLTGLVVVNALIRQPDPSA